MAVEWSHGHDVVKRSGRRSAPRAVEWSSRIAPLLEVLIAVAIGLAITWFLVIVSVSG
ncbi:hypothetical protein [Rhizobium sp. BK376]|uniref:hypothetical protein n=1 Tax=Rhizobium sp. BK376 TaxID=2512149 RepID=UPI0010E0643A|nr:hypothetical protein [Rhizobium sp. BK376]TCR85907.1 hypothetical protein EV561_106169 [Rhizobium sp. BK376]